MWEYRSIYYDNELYHFGIPGMRWGVRNEHRITAMRKRNEAIKKEENKYLDKKITKDQFKANKKTIKQNAKVDIKTFNKKVGKEHGTKLSETKRQTRKEYLASGGKGGRITQKAVRGSNTVGSTINSAIGIMGATVGAAALASGVGAAPAAAFFAASAGISVGSNVIKHRIVRRVSDALA